MTLIVCAMMDEAKAIASNLTLKEDTYFPIYEGNILNKDVLLIVSGVGKTNVTSATTYALTKYNVDLIINPGIAGGYKVLKNETYLVKQATYHDFDLTLFDYELGQVPNYPAKFQANLDLLNKISNLGLIDLYTGDKFATSPVINQPYVSDMEGAAIFQIAYKFKKDVISLKIVSDVIASENQIDNYKEIEASFDVELKNEVIKILEVL